MNIKCEKLNEALKATCIIQTAQSLINGFVMSGKGHRGNTVDTKKSFRSQNIVLAMFI